MPTPPQPIPPTLFKPLAAPGAAVYRAILLALFAETQRRQQPLAQELVLNIIVGILASTPNATELTRNGVDGTANAADTLQAHAGIILRELEQCGWLRTEIQHDCTRICILPDHAFHLLTLLDTSTASTPLSLVGYIYAIRDLLQAAISDSTGHEHIRLSEAHRQAMLLRHTLLALQHNMGLHIQQALRQFKSNTAIQRFFQHYHGEILDPAYHHLRTNDQLPRLRNEVLHALRLLQQNDRLTHLSPQMHEMRDLFQNLETTMQTIDVRHSQFVDAAIRSVAFHLVESSTTSSRIHALLTHLVDHPDQPLEPYQRIINLFELTLIDQHSLEQPDEAVEPFTPTPTPHPTVSPVELAQARARIQQQLNRATSREQVRRFVHDLLRDRAEIRAADIPLNGPADLPLLIALCSYADGSLGYTIEPPPDENTWVEHARSGFRDFVVKRTTPV